MRHVACERRGSEDAQRAGVTLLAGLLAVALAPAAVGEQGQAPVASAHYTVSEAPAPAPPRGVLADVPDLSAFTVAAIRARIPASFTGRSARLLPVDDLYFLHASNIVEMDAVWAAAGRTQPTTIVLGAGSYSLETVRRQIGDPGVLDRLPDGSHLLRRPIYISPTGTLVLSSGDHLKLSIRDGVFLYSNGELVVADSQVSTWDPTEDRYAPREDLVKERALFYREHTPRPYILASEGSRTFLGNSRFRGLGYKGTSGTFGISLTPDVNSGRLGNYLRRLASPTGWIVGNDIEELFFGFYSNHARDVAIVGNRFRDNVVYGVDPHDFSEQLIVARNLAEGSVLAHGIIFSRGVRDSWILENLSIGNAGSGVMLDRESTRNRVVANLALLNAGDGIAVYESSQNVVAGNVIRRNGRNGVHVRNSEDVRIEGNRIAANGGSGIEIGAADISGLETRDFELDPFVQRAGAEIWRNTFIDNGRSAIKAAATDTLSLYANEYIASGPEYFSGDLRPFAPALLARELGQEARTVITASGPASAPESTRRRMLPAGPERDESISVEVMRRHAERGVPRAMISLARHFADVSRHEPEIRRETIYWYGRATEHGWPRAMAELSYLLLGEPIYADEGVVLLGIADLLGDARARADLALLPHLAGVTSERLARARSEAESRLERRQLWNADLFRDVPVQLTDQEAASAFERLKRLDEDLERGRAPLAGRGGTLEPPPRLDAERRATFRKRAEEKNLARARYLARLDAERRENDLARGARRAYLDRLESRRRGAQLQVTNMSEGERRALAAELDRYLALVNAHREPAAALAADELLAEILRPPSPQ